ncbi:hypothetical protein I3842_01G034800 [Carya illinoinensis]|uniref:Uncharacterized protein n=1 Tax=Carya illinoinensis TaxID=32201 RepID=A0A922FZ85_CARIL|nr:hypothetical protein I3842_01G034800 [Carya illinoinensis]
MASTSSLTLSQALLARAISHHHHASNPSSSDRVVLDRVRGASVGIDLSERSQKRCWRLSYGRGFLERSSIFGFEEVPIALQS